MKFNAPTRSAFVFSLVLIIASLVGVLGEKLPVVTPHAFWFSVAGYAVLAAGCVFRRM
ncbi:MAG: hypothetical protein KDK99_11335 [Verrucomicrobiales bacterium]|nr:hypothetical protein [Verrucomicrobiales bacterium]